VDAGEWQVYIANEVREWLDGLNKELRSGTVRILLAFDPWRSSVLLVAGDKAGQ